MPYPVTFFPSGKIVHVETNVTLLNAAVQAGLLLNTPCGGDGTCAKCRVKIRAGNATSDGSVHHLSTEELAQGWRLACITPVTEPLEVEVPNTSLTQPLNIILVDGAPVSVQHDPTTQGHLGVAIDLGTTTVAGTLFDLYTGLERITHAAMNRQIPMGDDVISRIAAVRHDQTNLIKLQTLAVDTINSILQSLCEECGESLTSIHTITVAGNTTMQHLLLGLDPSALGEAPFTPAFTDAQIINAKSINLKVNPNATLTVFPLLGGFVGGDTVAGMLASNFNTRSDTCLLVDIGTNGEIALLKSGKIMVASTAAGPAFEGARIRQGMRAITGAIDRVWLQDNDFHYHVIGDVPAYGLCGSALVDTVAELLRLGLIDSSGSLALPITPLPTLTAAIKKRIQKYNDMPAFVLAYDTEGVPSVKLTQQDIRELQLASGAIRCGIETLLRRAQIQVSTLDSILLAGGFGNYINRENALRIGLLPPLPYQTIHFIGNASLTGAKRALLSHRELKSAQILQALSTHVELASEPGFSDLFMEYMFFPE